MTRRKPKPGSQAYNRAHGLREVVSIRMTREQIDTLDAAAKAAGMSRAEWIVSAAEIIKKMEKRLMETMAASARGDVLEP